MKDTLEFMVKVKEDLRTAHHRDKLNSLIKEVEAEITDTTVRFGSINPKMPSDILVYSQDKYGRNDQMILPRVRSQANNDTFRSPTSAVPVVFSKIQTAISVLFSKLPDGDVRSVNKIKARMYKELWKANLADTESNSRKSFEMAITDALTFGWGAWRQFPKYHTVERKKEMTETCPTCEGNGMDNEKECPKCKGEGQVTVKKGILKILYDDIFREHLSIKRTYFGLSYNIHRQDNRPEMFYEIDVTKEAYEKILKQLSKKKKSDETIAGLTPLSTDSPYYNTQEASRYVTLYYYENPSEDTLKVVSHEKVLYDGSLPSEEVYGSVVIIHGWRRLDREDPHGIGLYELMRGQEKMYNYILSLSAEGVANEVVPLLFSIGKMDRGNAEFTRSFSKINQLPAGTTIERPQVNGNTTLGVGFLKTVDANLELVSGITAQLAGMTSDDGLGESVVNREAALGRLSSIRTNIKEALERDAKIFFANTEQLHLNGREMVFSSEAEYKEFQAANPDYFTDVDAQLDENKKLIIKGEVSPFIPLTFGFDREKLEKNEQEVKEHGTEKESVPRSLALQEVNDVDDKVGSSKCIMVIDVDSLLTPSMEVQKQESIRLFPLISESLLQIMQLARADQEGAVTQLTTLKSFLTEQRKNIFDYIPKEIFDKIMGGTVGVDLNTQMKLQEHVQAMSGGSPIPQDGAQPASGSPTQILGSDNTPVTQAQSPEELNIPQSSMSAATEAAMGRIGVRGGMSGDLAE